MLNASVDEFKFDWFLEFNEWGSVVFWVFGKFSLIIFLFDLYNFLYLILNIIIFSNNDLYNINWNFDFFL